MAHRDARVGKWRGNWRMEWVSSTLNTTSEHGVSSITIADAHTSVASSRLNWPPPPPPPPACLHGLVRFAERRNLVSARVPSHYKRSLQRYPQWNGPFLMFTDEKLSYLSFVNFWPLKFQGRTLRASHLTSDGESRLAEETKQTPSPYYVTDTADPLASSATFCYRPNTTKWLVSAVRAAIGQYGLANYTKQSVKSIKEEAVSGIWVQWWSVNQSSTVTHRKKINTSEMRKRGW